MFSLNFRVIWEESVALNKTMETNSTISAEENLNSEIRQEKILIYSILLLASLIVYMTRTYGYFIMCLRIAYRIHNRLFDGISRAAMYFFNTNPSGRILNRFAKDINVVDSTLPATFLDVLSVSFFSNKIVMVLISIHILDIYGYNWSLCYSFYSKLLAAVPSYSCGSTSTFNEAFICFL